MPLLSKIGNTLKSCISTATDFAGTQTMNLLSRQYPDIDDVMNVLDQVKERVEVKYETKLRWCTYFLFILTQGKPCQTIPFIEMTIVISYFVRIA